MLEKGEADWSVEEEEGRWRRKREWRKGRTLIKRTFGEDQRQPDSSTERKPQAEQALSLEIQTENDMRGKRTGRNGRTAEKERARRGPPCGAPT